MKPPVRTPGPRLSRAVVVAGLLLAAALAWLVLVRPASAQTTARLLLSSNADGDLDIYTMPVDGGALTRVTDLTGDESSPVWSPDATEVAFVSDPDALVAGDERIFVVAVDGTVYDDTSGLTPLVDIQARFPTWSPDGSEIAFQGHDGDGDFDLFVVGADGIGLTKVVDNSVPDIAPDWGPGGIVLVRDSTEVVVVDLSTGTTTASFATGPAAGPRWSPDGATIAYSEASSGALRRIAAIDVTSSTITGLTDGSTRDIDPAWSADGSTIVFARNPDPLGGDDFDLWTMGPDGTGHVQLTTALTDEIGPDWEPVATPPLDELVTEAVAVTDVVTIAVEVTAPPVTEGVSVNDTLRVAVEVGVPVAEAVAVTDTVRITIEAALPVAEAVTVTDTVRITVEVSLSIADGVAVTDRVTITVSDQGLITGPDGEALSEAAPGDEITYSAGGFDPGSEVGIELRSDPILLATTSANEGGRIEVAIVLPTDVEPGEHTLAAVGIDPDGLPHEVLTPITIIDRVPRIVTVGTSHAVQYSDVLVPIEVVIADHDSAATELSVTLSGQPAGVDVAPLACEVLEGITVCRTEIGGVVGAAAGTYPTAITSSDGVNTHTAGVTIAVTPEDGSVALDPDNPVAIEVASPGGDSGPFTLALEISEASPDEGFLPGRGDVSLAGVQVTLKPVGPGSAITGDCTATGDSAVRHLSCAFEDVPVGTYVLLAELDGTYFAGAAEDALTVYDPSLGFTTGAGWFTWPGSGSPGDRTTFGYTMRYNRKGTNLQGQLLLIRHLDDGSVIRIESNALDGLAIGETGDVAWASFSGKATFTAGGVDEGNYTFRVYVEDVADPGAGSDRIWIEIRDRDGNVVEAVSLPWAPVDEAVVLGGGDIAVPTESREGGPR